MGALKCEFPDTVYENAVAVFIFQELLNAEECFWSTLWMSDLVGGYIEVQALDSSMCTNRSRFQTIVPVSLVSDKWFLLVPIFVFLVSLRVIQIISWPRFAFLLP